MPEIKEFSYPFFSKLAKTLNSGQSRAVVLSGNIYDIFWNGKEYVPLIPFLCEKTKIPSVIQVSYELNGPIRMDQTARKNLQLAYTCLKMGVDEFNFKTFKEDLNNINSSTAKKTANDFDSLMAESIGNVSVALELMRQLCLCTRLYLKENLLFFIEAADMIVPAGNGDVANLNDAQMRRISIMQDWFGDPAFVSGNHSVVLIAESKSLIHPRISRLPQITNVEISSPSLENRKHYIDLFCKDIKNPICPSNLPEITAGLSVYALRHLLMGAKYAEAPMDVSLVIEKVEDFIQSQVGEDVVEFKKPFYKLDKVVGSYKIKKLIKDEIIPRFIEGGDRAFSAIAVAGALGSGKTFTFEAMAAELDMPVVVLKGLRSQWFGQTDLIFERLKRALEALDKVVIFCDEADTMFGGLGADTHETERRLTGKIQQMMSDPRLKGKVVWILMTARINMLSPDIRREGRAGDLIIPILDPEGEERTDFLKWAFKNAFNNDIEFLKEMNEILPHDYSAASFAKLRSNLPANCDKIKIKEIIAELLPPSIGLTRRYQTLQALVNCTRMSLLPDKIGNYQQAKDGWFKEIQELEARGIK